MAWTSCGSGASWREQGGARYDFTHDRIRDVAYAASSPVKRAHFHRRVAQALEKLHAADLDPIAGELGDALSARRRLGGSVHVFPPCGCRGQATLCP